MGMNILATGEKIQGYEIERTLGVGGFGVVYLAHDGQAPERKYAIKLLQPRGSKQEESRARQSFLNEIMNMAKLSSHDGIVKVINSVIHTTAQGDQLGVVMEFVEGTSLFDYINQQGKMVHDRAIPLILLILKALDFAHGHGIIHRDIKPENIMVQTGRTLKVGGIETHPIKVMDFGLSKVFEGSTAQDSTGWGTREYMPPERVRSAGEKIGLTSDIYSVGVLFYVMLTGDYPFKIADMDPFQAIETICKAEVPSVRTSYEFHPAGLDAVIRKAMAKNPAQRYQSCMEMARAITPFLPGSEAFLKDVPPAVQLPMGPTMSTPDRAKAVETASFTSRPTQPGSITPPPPPPQRPKGKGLLIGGVSAAILAVGLGVYALTSGGKAPGSQPDVVATQLGGFDQLLNEARAGDVKAQHQIGVKYFEGKDVKKDYVESARWFTKAADNGYAESQYNLAQLYESGTGVQKDANKAITYYEKAASQDYSDAMYRLGMLFYNQNMLNKAKPWLEKASQHGSSPAQVQLGLIYFYQKDQSKAFEYFSKAADAGNVSAQANLGVLQSQRGNFTEALRLWKLAADAGNAVAMYQLGLAYEKGKGVTADKGTAREWLTKAADKGLPDAKRELTRL